MTEDCTSWCTALLWIVPAKVEGTWQLPQGALTLTQKFQMVSGTLGSAADQRRAASRRGDHLHRGRREVHGQGERQLDERHDERRQRRQVVGDAQVATLSHTR